MAIFHFTLHGPVSDDEFDRAPTLGLLKPLVVDFEKAVAAALGQDVTVRYGVSAQAPDTPAAGAKRGRKPRLPLEPLSTAPVAEPPAADAPRFGRKHDKAA